MATMQATALLRAPLPSREPARRRVQAISRPQVHLGDTSLSLRKMPASVSTADPLKMAATEAPTYQPPARGHAAGAGADDLVTSKLYAVMEVAADRIEMHDIIGVQRDNWNLLLLNSINAMTLTASISAGLSSIPLDGASPHHAAFRISSALLYSAATVMLLAVNKIQPSQLAEEQRNATRLFRQLDAVDRVLALDTAYPLPLLPGMLEKFPKTIEPTVWWPKRGRARSQSQSRHKNTMAESSQSNNGWNEGLEGVMAGILKMLKKTDTEEYLTFGALALSINKVLAITGPVLTGVAAAGAALSDSAILGPWPLLLAVVGGALATAVNTLEHGAQVGMIFELFRNNAGYYRQLEEEIEVNLSETDVEERENGEMFELKMALRLGRSLSDLRSLSSSSSSLQGQRGWPRARWQAVLDASVSR
ncbi:unnamed protein product [Spirodela intermedia]|uniref:Uncharacterized protein n=1 Tax=Spirodela intermedia TaxID=51605 RepID=A0A7I8J8L2_SPIIN|nr:unnamed protein product [Spirodela intermedia]CAA6666095.1 unnamed protein product [Spirodela intermedia]